MKKHQRFLRGCAALLCAVLLLTGNTAPAMAAKVTQADIDALKNDASNLDKQQKEIQSQLSDLKARWRTIPSSIMCRAFWMVRSPELLSGSWQNSSIPPIRSASTLHVLSLH